LAAVAAIEPTILGEIAVGVAVVVALTNEDVREKTQEDVTNAVNKIVEGIKNLAETDKPTDSNKDKFTPEQQEVIKKAKQAKKLKNLTKEEAEDLVEEAKEAGLPARGPGVHPNCNFKETHIHIGPVNHIPIE
jgi:methylthioribose-1-phosphate isomerase